MSEASTNRIQIKILNLFADFIVKDLDALIIFPPPKCTSFVFAESKIYGHLVPIFLKSRLYFCL